MGDAARKLIEQVMALPEDERIEVASVVWASVDRDPDPAWETAWRDEVARRLVSPEPRLSWEEVRAQVLARVQAR
jgi:putative addiction module component (TIGR02574 family)